MAALAPGYFDVDELSFENLLTMSAEFAANLKYYNLGNEVDGDWGALFAADEAVAMASILSTDLAALEAEFFGYSHAAPDELCRFMLGIAGRIDRWYLRLSVCRHQSAELLALGISTLITDKLAVELHNLCLLAERRGVAENIGHGSEFAGIWGLGGPDSAKPFPRATVTEWRDENRLRQQLGASFYAFSNSISHLKSTAAVQLQLSLNSGQHDPATGLFLVFLKLYQKAQGKLNSFTSRHLDFYYEQVLGSVNREPVPESYYLLFEVRGNNGHGVIPAGTEFSAGKDAELNDIIYLADDTLQLNDTRVESLATLYLQHDFLVSPEYELGAVTRMKVDWPPLLPTGQATEEITEPVQAWSLLGVEKSGIDRAAAIDARIGFCVVSSSLLLGQGVRKIDVGIELETDTPVELDSRISGLLRCNNEASFRHCFGKLFARYLICFQGCLDARQKSEITAVAQSLLPRLMAREVESLLGQDWQGLFYKVFKQAFRLELTAASGWLDVQDYVLLPYSEQLPAEKSGFRLSIRLGQEVEPIVAYDSEIHGNQLETDLPVLRCAINPQAGFCVYSILQELVVSSLQIEVEVSGLKNLQAYNQHGQLDPSKPFQPFGPLPGMGSYFVFGNYEMAKKQLVELGLNVEWGDLPRDVGGFHEYYRGYDTRFGNGSFKAGFSTLADGRWMSGDGDMGLDLFATDPASSRVLPDRSLNFSRLEYARPVDDRLAQSDYRYDLKSARGFYRLSLGQPESAFGHGEYTRILTRVLAANARRRKQALVPRPPYTPMLNRISLAYRAIAEIDPARRSSNSGGHSDTFIHLHPFGVETRLPEKEEKPLFLLPRYRHTGNLFIGLGGSRVAGPLSLLFHLAPGVVSRSPAGNARPDWYYLSAIGWKKLLAENLLSDSTHGFLTSGIVKLDIPTDISRDSKVMPDGHFWLRISSGTGAATCASCFSIQSHGLKVSRRHDAARFQYPEPRSPIGWTPVRALPGSGDIRQVSQAFGGRAREDDSEKRTRIAERLRHKNRAVLPWDYEQLVLEQFPEVQKVKCFSGFSSREDAIKPGQVLIVVVPANSNRADEHCSHRMIDAPVLKRISDFVQRHCSAFVDVEVRNPLYEQIQVRCTVKFDDANSDGINISRLNRHISDYICPWKSIGYGARFGWRIKQQDIESHIRDLGYVAYVTNFSMLHITVDNAGNYSQFDTAKGEQAYQAVIGPRYPWSLALPAEKHFIETLSSARSIDAEITGIDELAVGSTFIITGSDRNGEEE